MLIYAEGGCTNGDGLMHFKKGGFYGEKAVQPMFIKYNRCFLNPSYETIPYLALEFFMCSTFCTRAEIHKLPHFKPNEYLFKTHADKGTERWEIFAWAVRDIMMK